MISPTDFRKLRFLRSMAEEDHVMTSQDIDVVSNPVLVGDIPDGVSSSKQLLDGNYCACHLQQNDSKNINWVKLKQRTKLTKIFML